MGCDIHSHAEKMVDGRWERVAVEAFEDRSYGFFGWLAGVRNYSAMRPIAADRGIPADVSRETAKAHEAWGYDAHSASWVSLAELQAVDYDQIVEDRRTTKQLAPNFWTGGATCEPGEGKKQTLRDFLGPGFFAAMKRLEDAEVGRVVFWFDN